MASTQTSETISVIPSGDTTSNDTKTSSPETIPNFDTIDADSKYPRRLRKAEAVLLGRTSRILLVLEHGHDMCNQLAIMRSAECMGIQHIWLVKNQGKQAKNLIHAEENENKARQGKEVALRNNKISKSATTWLSVRTFETTEACVEALREDGRTIWATELSQSSDSLMGDDLKLPERLAIVMGRELDGVSPAMIRAADRLVHIPMFGWSESFNLSVASALCIQRLFAICPEARGSMSDSERQTLREQWYAQLAKTPKHTAQYAPFINNPPPPFTDLRRPEKFRKENFIQRKNKQALATRNA